jgi:hypothetical protein
MLFFRLPAEDEAQVRDLAKAKGTTVSAELRRAVRGLLAFDSPESRS